MSHRLLAVVALAAFATSAHAVKPATTKATIQRYALPNSTFPIARAVEVPAGSTIYHSGATPDPARPDAEKFGPEYWGDTKAQSLSVLGKIKTSLESLGVGMKDVVKMNVYLVPAAGATAMDFAGFMEAYTQFFGTPDQPVLPARTTVQISGLASPGMLVEIEVIVARP